MRMIWPARWSWVVLPLLALACVAAPAGTRAVQLSPQPVPTLVLRLGYNGVVVTAQTPEPQNKLDPPPRQTAVRSASGTHAGGFSCPKSVVLVAPTPDVNGNQFCVTASTDALSIAFASPAVLPYASQKTVTCTQLRGASANPALSSALVRIGRARTEKDTIAYDGARAQCDFNAGFGYAYAVEKQSGAAPVAANEKNVTRTLSIPWDLLHLDGDSRSIMLQTGGYEFLIPLQVFQGSVSISTDYAPYVRLSTPVPSGGAAPLRARDVELNVAFSPNRHHMLAASFAQNQSTISVQRALSNALSLAPVSLGGPARMTVGQDLQTQSQTLFTFLQPSNFLEDQSVKSLFDSTPFSVNKLSSLSAGYAYGFSSDPFTAGAFYGVQSAGSYNGGATATFILTTPVPSPEPAPAFARQPTAANAPEHVALHPPAPPGPFFESGTASTPPFELSFINAFNGSRGTRDAIDALAFEAHVYHNQSRSGAEYYAQTFNIFGRLEHDFRTPAGTAPGSIGEFAGQSATFTSGSSDERGSHYFQLRETIGAQMNDRFFAPSSGTVSWLAPLSGPMAHLTAAFAAGKTGRYYALDLLGFRLTNSAGDLAAQEGWQVTIPVAGPGWLLSGGSLTQTVSDRIAAINQGLISGYAQAIAQVPNPQIRPQHLANVSVLSPWLSAGRWQLELAGGYNTGTVTACGATISAKSTTYQCLTVLDSRAVGGIALRDGALLLGATDTSIQSGSISAGDAARGIGTSGGLPGAVTGYISFTGCPQISAAYANAAMVSGIPFPQQGSTFSSQLDWPLAAGNERFDIVLGYFNERALANASFNDSGFAAVLRLGTTFHPALRCGK
jgi:hypothetical protein